MALKVIFRPQAEADLLALYRYIAEASGLGIASGYIDRIEIACMSLATFPNRGTKRDDLAPGLRTIAFEDPGDHRLPGTKDPGGNRDHCLWRTGFRKRSARRTIWALIKQLSAKAQNYNMRDNCIIIRRL